VQDAVLAQDVAQPVVQDVVPAQDEQQAAAFAQVQHAQQVAAFVPAAVAFEWAPDEP